MIEIKELRALRGPNRYTRHTATYMVLDIKAYEEKPSDKIPGFSDRLLKHIPTLIEHGCSIGEPGGFLQRLKRGTWAGHIIEHIAIELQCLAGTEVSYGKTFCTLNEGIYVVVFRYKIESVGLQAAKDAISIFEALAEGKDFDIDQVISNLKVLREDDMLGPTTWSIIKEAQSRGIPYIRLNDNSHVQLGHGVHQKRIQASMTCQTSAIAVEEADEKTRVKEHLKRSGIPVPYGKIVTTLEEAIDAFNDIGSAVVVKPDVGNHGKGATVNVTDLEQLKIAFHIAKARHYYVIVEEYVEGLDFRLLVIDGKLVAAAKRDPAHVIGDGESSVQSLITKTNSDPRRGFGHEKALTRIEIDKMTETLLSSNGLTLDSCPEEGEIVYLKTTANLSQGGTATDVTDMVNPEIRRMSERIAKIIGLDCMGIDVLAKDITLPIEKSGIKLIEVNAAPGFRMHLEPTYGKARNVGKPMIDMLFPNDYIQTPIVAVTGTNGKTTTCKLITHALKFSGQCVGLACTTGIEIDGNSILSGDYSGPEGAGIVTREPTVDHIVLEVARGGIQRRGLGVNKVDVGVLLNIGNDHLGTDLIESQEDLNLIKSTVIEAVKDGGTSVLNAEDEITMSVLARAQGHIILFAIDPNNENIDKHLKGGHTVVTIENRNVIIKTLSVDISICSLEEIPITFGGIVEFNIANALAAVAALHGLKLSAENIRNGIMTFYPTPNQNPGRMNLFDFPKYKVLLDYGHNTESANAFAKLLPRFSAGRKVALCHGTGSRTNEQIIEYGKALAPVYDYIVLTDLDPRSRKKNETTKLMKKGLISGGFQAKNIEIALDADKALDCLFSKAETGDLLVIHPNDLEPIMGQIMDRHREEMPQAL
ncbi:MAG: cyanophycin synthetase [Chlamydiales bacterium]|jgi:cyanophycin synthetase